MTKQQWEEVLTMQKAFKRLYSTSGLVDVCSDYVQIRYDTFLEMFGDTTHEVTPMDDFKQHEVVLSDGTKVVALEAIR